MPEGFRLTCRFAAEARRAYRASRFSAGTLSGFPLTTRGDDSIAQQLSRNSTRII